MTHRTRDRSGESGNVFTILIAAVALLGILSFATYNILSGPVATMARINQRTMAEAHMHAVAQVIIAEAVEDTTDGGDCDADGSVEPAQYVNSAPQPTGGGQIPTGLGVSGLDTWGTELGYCVWDVGTASDAAGCGGGGALRLDGDDDVTDNSTTDGVEANKVMAIISAGPNRIHESTCNAYANDTTDPLAIAGDDISVDYTYNEAGGAGGGGLWNLKTADADVAEITKNLEVTTPGSAVMATIGEQTINTVDYEAVGDFVAVKTDNIFERGGTGINLHDDINLIQDAGVADREFFGILMSQAKGTADDLITTGEGVRMFFYPKKAAFRAGEIVDADGAGGADITYDEWDDGNIGDYSVAFGRNTEASGEGSFAAGIDDSCTNGICNGPVASGSGSAAFGMGTIADGVGSLVAGYNNNVTGDYSFAAGRNNTVAGNLSVALGHGITVNGANSVGIDLDSTTTYTIADASTMAIMGGQVGIDLASPLQTLHVEGVMLVTEKAANESLTTEPSVINDHMMFFYPARGAFRAGTISSNDTAWNSGNLGFYSTAFGENTQASGIGSFAAGHETTASANYSVALGDTTTADGLQAMAIGANTTATGQGSLAGGDNTTTTAAATNSFIFGKDGTVSGTYSAAFGENNSVSGNNSFAFGEGMTVSGNNSFGVNLYSGSSTETLAQANTMAIMQGQVGINNLLPAVELGVDGDINYTGTLTDTSDQRLKTNIKPLAYDWDKLNKIRPVSFQRKDDEEKRTEFGVIAQELEFLYPELVQTLEQDGKGLKDVKSVNYVGMIPVLIKASQRLKSEQDELNAERAALRKDIDQLKRLAGLETGITSRTDLQILAAVAIPGIALVLFGGMGLFRRREKKS